jgi:hypothetical protein
MGSSPSTIPILNGKKTLQNTDFLLHRIAQSAACDVCPAPRKPFHPSKKKGASVTFLQKLLPGGDAARGDFLIPQENCKIPFLFLHFVSKKSRFTAFFVSHIEFGACQVGKTQILVFLPLEFSTALWWKLWVTFALQVQFLPVLPDTPYTFPPFWRVFHKRTVENPHYGIFGTLHKNAPAAHRGKTDRIKFPLPKPRDGSGPLIQKKNLWKV